jgi:HSP20 family protein
VSQVLPERRSGSASERLGAFSELEQVSERMRQMLDQTFGGTFTDPSAWTPPVDIEEEDDEYVVEADVPGVKGEDVNIELVGNQLTITGEIKEREKKGVVRRRMRRVGRFEYRVVLPDEVDPEKVDAKLNDGVLTVRIPKSQQAQRRKINVKSS